MIELLGLLLPPLIDLITYLTNKIPDVFLGSQARFWLSLTVCALLGLGINYLSHGNNFGDQNSIAMSILAVFGASQVSYKAVWEKTQAHLNLKSPN